MSDQKPIIIVQGAQWGSEGKGMVAAALCQLREVDLAVRTGAVNAGHTVYFKGKPFKMQQLPTGWVNHPQTRLVIGAGALVHPDIWYNEISMVCGALGTEPTVYVDDNAGLHMPEHTQRAQASGRHHAIGATGKGCSEALIDRIKGRGGQARLLRDAINIDEYACDTSAVLNAAYDAGKLILLEGTQGSLLDLYFGPYPYTTHKPTQASTWIQEAGLSPKLKYEVALVTRTFPIRVAGNSGPMPKEMDWISLAIEINKKLDDAGHRPMVSSTSLLRFTEACMIAAGSFDLPRNHLGLARFDFHNFHTTERVKYKEAISELHAKALGLLAPEIVSDLRKLFEFTTVTNKLRRIARFDISSLCRSVMWNRPDYIVLTFLNYEYPEIWGLTDWAKFPSDVYADVMQALRDIRAATGVPVRYVTTGPESIHMLEVKEVAYGAAGSEA